MTSTTDVLFGVTTAATAGEVVFGAAIAIACMMIAVWAISLVMRDASIVDIAWGSGFVLVAWVSYWLSDGNSTRSLLLTVLTTIWGLRLAFYLAKRNLGHGEDFRYQSMRRKHGDRFANRQFVYGFWFAGFVDVYRFVAYTTWSGARRAWFSELLVCFGCFGLGVLAFTLRLWAMHNLLASSATQQTKV